MNAGRARLAAGLAAAALLAGCSAAGAQRAEPPPAAAATTGPAAAGVDAAREFHSTRGYRATPVPVRIDIPAIGVTSSLDRLGRAPDRLVTCGGEFDATAGHYRSNIIVFATLRP
jgi:hypothetical protein